MKKVSELLQASANIKKEAAEKNVRFLKKNKGNDEKRSDLLQEKIGSGSIASYAQMAEEIYGDASVSEGTLSSLASRFKRKSLEEIALLDLKPVIRSELDKMRYEVQRNLMIADLFYVKGKSVTSIHIWKKSLAIAQRHGFTFEACQCAMRLNYQYAFRKRKADHYNMTRMLQTLLQQAVAESEAAKLYQNIMMLVKDRWYFPTSYSRNSGNAYRRIYALARKHKTHELWLATFRVHIYHHHICHDYRGCCAPVASTEGFLLKTCIFSRTHAGQTLPCMK